MKKLAIIGSGDLGKLIAHHAIHTHKIVGFFDDFAEKGSLVSGNNVLGKLSEIETLYKASVFDEIILAIGYKHFKFREEIFNSLKTKMTFATIIHPSCYVDSSCNIGEGSCLLPGTVLDHNVNIAPNVLINVGCTIAHDSSIGSHTFLSPCVAIAGFVKIGSRCNIGINTTVIDNTIIENDIQTGGGTTVTDNLQNKGLYVGSPARFIR